MSYLLFKKEYPNEESWFYIDKGENRSCMIAKDINSLYVGKKFSRILYEETNIHRSKLDFGDKADSKWISSAPECFFFMCMEEWENWIPSEEISPRIWIQIEKSRERLINLSIISGPF